MTYFRTLRPSSYKSTNSEYLSAFKEYYSHFLKFLLLNASLSQVCERETLLHWQLSKVLELPAVTNAPLEALIDG